jgi:hypothetical protein
VVCGMLSGFGTVTERDFIIIQIVWNAKERDWAQCVGGGGYKCFTKYEYLFSRTGKLTGKGLQYVAHLTPGFG